VVRFENSEDSTTIISGLTLQNGLAEHGGGIYCDSSSPVIIRNIIRDNRASGGVWYHGGGIYCENNSSAIINGNIITGNSSFGGGGIYCIQSNLTIINNVIFANSVRMGGGIHCRESNPVIQDNTIYENTATSLGGGLICSDADPIIINNYIGENIVSNPWPPSQGGGVFLLRSNPIILNTSIVGNTAGEAAGIYLLDNSNPIIVNSVFFGNQGLDWGGAIACFDSCSPLVINSVLWANTPYEISLDYNSDPQFAYCDIQEIWPGVGNINLYPFFRNQDTGDFHLMSTACGDSADSPCIDAGDPAILDSLLDCSWGLGGTRSDMGAYGGGDSTTVDVSENQVHLPHRILLHQNYPNPFNASTTIEFTLPEAADVRLSIYDLLGREIAVLVSGFKPAGNHGIIFDAEGLSSGVYFYNLSSGNSYEIKRMVFLK
jgi:hypothetical protein